MSFRLHESEHDGMEWSFLTRVSRRLRLLLGAGISLAVGAVTGVFLFVIFDIPDMAYTALYQRCTGGIDTSSKEWLASICHADSEVLGARSQTETACWIIIGLTTIGTAVLESYLYSKSADPAKRIKHRALYVMMFYTVPLGIVLTVVSMVT